MDNKNYIVYGKPDIQQAEIDEIIDSMKNAWIGTGPKVHLFEKNFAQYKNIPENTVVALNSCTAALHLALLASGVKKGDEVITTGMTFCATVNAIIHAGGTPVIADIQPDTYNICPDDIVKKITKKTKAIVPVHFAGNPCDMEKIMAIANKYNLKVIEDCAHAIESEFKGRKLGTFGDFGCFSFYVTKNMTTGEGGMVISKNRSDAERIKVLALHGMSSDAWKRFSDDGYNHYEVVEPGFKYNMMDIQAAIGIHQLKRVEKNRKKREKIFHYYQQELSGLAIKLPHTISPNTDHDDIKHSFHLYSILIPESKNLDRDKLICRLHEKKIGVGVHYRSILSHQYYRNYVDQNCKTPIADSVGNQTLSLPLSAIITSNDAGRIVDSVKQLCKTL